jgi:hypothetical protein
MMRIPIDVYKRLQNGEVPISYCMINTHMGIRVYGEKEINMTNPISGALETSGRVISFGTFERTLQPLKDNVLVAYNTKQKTHDSLQLDNIDLYFSKLIATEPFLGRPLSIWLGFESDPQSKHFSIFSGIILEISALPILTIEADER